MLINLLVFERSGLYDTHSLTYNEEELFRFFHYMGICMVIYALFFSYFTSSGVCYSNLNFSNNYISINLILNMFFYIINFFVALSGLNGLKFSLVEVVED